MSEPSIEPTGPDFEKGCHLSQPQDGGMLTRHASGEEALVARGEEFFAVSATCTHHGGSLGEKLMVDCTVRGRPHPAQFDLPHISYLHTLSESRGIIERATNAHRLIGSSFMESDKESQAIYSY